MKQFEWVQNRLNATEPLDRLVFLDKSAELNGNMPFTEYFRNGFLLKIRLERFESVVANQLPSRRFNLKVAGSNHFTTTQLPHLEGRSWP